MAYLLPPPRVTPGIGSRLFDKAVAEARARGAAKMYISAACSENTIRFYRAKGAVRRLPSTAPSTASSAEHGTLSEYCLQGYYVVALIMQQ
jgi:ribosomal protein S18 acetylase RimI-like enzyme